MRIVPVVLFALMLSACQQPAPDVPASANDAQQPPLRFFEPEFAALQNQMLIGLASGCRMRASEAALFDRCLRERTAAAFDDSGEGRTHCAFHPGFGDFFDCIAMGNTLIDVMRRMTDTSPLPAGFWDGNDAMIRALSRSIVSRGVANCRTDATAPTLNRCIDQWFEDHLALVPDLTRRCPSQVDTRQACLVEAVMVRFMRDHVPRLSAIGV
jgi:hypothetical protein